MSHTAICVADLSKRYRIGTDEENHDTLFGATASWLRSPVDNFRRLRRLSRFDDEESDDVIWALRDVSFEVKHGEAVGLIGRNGAGKSTLLKILSRITEPTGGRIDLYGRVASLLEVGTGFHPELTGRENVYLNGVILGMTKVEVDRKFDEIVAFSGVEKFIDTPVKRYSSGMKVRLAFAVAAHLEPEILLVDEVLAVGDVAFQKKCLGKMEDVAGEGRTVIFVSHHMNMIQALCDRAILMEHGRIALDASVDVAVRQYMLTAEETAAETSLLERADRKGEGTIRFKHVAFVDERTGTVLDTLVSGQPVRIRVDLQSLSERALHDVAIGVSFYAADSGAHMTAYRSDAVGQVYTIGPGTTTLHCEVPKWPLKGGRYFFNLFASHRGAAADWVKEAGFIDVQEGDFYGTGVVPARGRAGVLVDFRWEDGIASVGLDRAERNHHPSE